MNKGKKQAKRMVKNANSTIAAIATAPGGALALIRVSGPDAISLLSTSFRAANGRPITEAQTATAHYGTIHDGEGMVDEVVVTVFRAPHSYTGEDSVEISCHGSRYILNRVLALLISAGCQQAAPGEFTQRAFLNGKLDLSQAEAVADLIASTNRATHHLALSQLRGHFSSELSLLREQLLRLTSLLELELDFSDHDDLVFADRSEILDLAQHIDARILSLADSFQAGRALKEGIAVAIIGPPNVGKSTLLNALLGEERAIVSDIEGTTRDTIEDVITLDGIQFRFVDTAGIHHTDDRIEKIGIQRALQAAEKARIICLMTEPGMAFPQVVLREEQTVIRIINKAEDILNAPNQTSPIASTPSVDSTDVGQERQEIFLSAKHGLGLDALRKRLLSFVPHPTENDVIVTSARHYEALLRAHNDLSRVLDGLQQQLSTDLLAEDLRLVLHDLASITGQEITAQETLNNIFSHFCIGK